MRFKFKRIIIALIIIFITIFLALFARATLQEKSKTNTSSRNTNITDIFTNNSQIELEEAYVTKVIDGDTIWALINGNEEKIRLIGIDCPEYTKEIEAYGKEATEFTTEKLLNKTIYLQKDITNTDNYGRLLRYVWTQKIDEITDENTKNYLFNYTLVYEGLANSNYYKPNTTLQNYLEEAEDYAKENKKGMWQ